MLSRWMKEWERRSHKEARTAFPFRYRGENVSRLEGFSDAVFGFAVTLLVLSVEPPRTFDQMIDLMRGTPVFAICFAFLYHIWRQQYVYFRRYGLNDTTTFRLTGFLLFLVLLYVYPLRFVFTVAIAWLTNGRTLPADSQALPMLRSEQIPASFVLYGIGYAALHITFAALFHHAYKCRETLELTRLEVFDTCEDIGEHLITAAFGVLSAVVAYTLPAQGAGLARFAYTGMAPAFTIFKSITGNRRRALVRAEE